jgi:hypothetical protein
VDHNESKLHHGGTVSHSFPMEDKFRLVPLLGRIAAVQNELGFDIGLIKRGAYGLGGSIGTGGIDQEKTWKVSRMPPAYFHGRYERACAAISLVHLLGMVVSWLLQKHKASLFPKSPSIWRKCAYPCSQRLMS